MVKRMTLGAAALSAAPLLQACGSGGGASASSGPIKIGFPTALTGLEAILGETQLNCAKLAADEVNAKGGVLGRKLQIISADEQTDSGVTVQKVSQLIKQDNVDVIMGMITSTERAAAQSIAGPLKKLVIYPTYYEGQICDKYYISTGQVPNQSVDPFIPWIVKNIGKRMYILGADYRWPRVTAQAIKASLESAGGQVVGQDFFPFGTTDFSSVLSRIRSSNADVVWSMEVGSDAVALLKQYASFGLAGKVPMVTNGLDELFTSSIKGPAVDGLICNQSWFMTMKRPQSKAFVSAYQAKFGQGKLINSIGEATYTATHLYAEAVKAAGRTDADAVVKAFPKVSFAAPQGDVAVEASNHHMRSNSVIGRCKGATGMFDIVEDFGVIAPKVPGCNLA
jgi:urea transport system substrate-binding protein